MPDLYMIGPVPGKGQGMFACTRLQAGSRILADEPLVVVADSTIKEGVEERISQSLGTLSPEQLQKFDALYCPDHPTRASPAARYLANCFEIEKPTSGIFLNASRANHSCYPNAIYAWNQNLRRLTIHAIDYIEAGEEITVSYDLPFFSLATRRKLLRDFYAFECDCPVCHDATETENGRRGEERRERMETVYNAIVEYKRGPRRDDEKELIMILEFVGLAEDEQIGCQTLPDMYRRASVLCEDRGSKALALMYVERGYELGLRLLGADHLTTMKTAVRVLGLKATVRGP